MLLLLLLFLLYYQKKQTFAHPRLVLEQFAWKPMNQAPGRGNRKYFVRDVELADSSSLPVDDVQVRWELYEDGREPLWTQTLTDDVWLTAMPFCTISRKNTPTNVVVLIARPWPGRASRPNFYGFGLRTRPWPQSPGLGLESCIDNFLTSPSDSSKI